MNPLTAAVLAVAVIALLIALSTVGLIHPFWSGVVLAFVGLVIVLLMGGEEE